MSDKSATDRHWNERALSITDAAKVILPTPFSKILSSLSLASTYAPAHVSLRLDVATGL